VLIDTTTNQEKRDMNLIFRLSEKLENIPIAVCTSSPSNSAKVDELFPALRKELIGGIMSEGEFKSFVKPAAISCSISTCETEHNTFDKSTVDALISYSKIHAEVDKDIPIIISVPDWFHAYDEILNICKSAQGNLSKIMFMNTIMNSLRRSYLLRIFSDSLCYFCIDTFGNVHQPRRYTSTDMFRL
jgi:hypothetical protein